MLPPDITTTFDQSPVGGVTGPKWLESVVSGFNALPAVVPKHVRVDLSGIAFATLSEWLTAVSIFEKLLATNPGTSQLDLDLIGKSGVQLLEPAQYINWTPPNHPIPEAEAAYQFSDRVYRVAGFLESLGTLKSLNSPDRTMQKVIYPGMSKADAAIRKFFTRDERYTVLLGITRVRTKEDCKQFLDDHQIQSWRAEMGVRFPKSPLFESEEIWRVFCHELAVNIWEHSESTGFMCARVIQSPATSANALAPRWRATYSHPIDSWILKSGGAFLELCVSDAGRGVIDTLKKSCESHSSGVAEDTSILCFAFDELGTCKDKNTGWATERHALGRILQIIAKYGGVLKLRSGRAEVLYTSHGGRFERRRNQLGYEPQAYLTHPNSCPGTHLQLLLPLVPEFKWNIQPERRSVFELTLPKGYRIQPDQVRGHIVPLLEVLDEPASCVGQKEQQRFRSECEKLNSQLLRERPRLEPIVLDFSGLDWTPAQFETLLHLLQNVLQHRPALLVELHPKLAEGVAQLEAQSAPTYLSQDNSEASPSVTGKAFGQIPESRFMETYSRVHSTVLAIDRDGKRFIYGLLDRRYERLLLNLLDSDASLRDLSSENLGGEPVNEGLLRAILNAANPLFQYDPKMDRWRAVWSPESLAIETSRSMSRHFDSVAERSTCHAFSPYGGLHCGSEFGRRPFTQSNPLLSRAELEICPETQGCTERTDSETASPW